MCKFIGISVTSVATVGLCIHRLSGYLFLVSRSTCSHFSGRSSCVWINADCLSGLHPGASLPQSLLFSDGPFSCKVSFNRVVLHTLGVRMCVRDFEGDVSWNWCVNVPQIFMYDVKGNELDLVFIYELGWQHRFIWAVMYYTMSALNF